MLRVGIIGVKGYVGEELLKILLNHPEVKIKHIFARLEQDTNISLLFAWAKNRADGLVCESKLSVKEIAKDTDFVFLALPHCVSMEYAPLFLKLGVKVIDLSADYRIKDTALYEKWYKHAHIDKINLKHSVYGLCELNFAAIKKANLIANPGCYPTGVIISLAPLLSKGLVSGKVIIDAKSGATGAGRSANAGLMYAEVNEDFKAYKIDMHQHKPEIIQELSNIAGKTVSLTFVPHLLPINRGILSTIYVNLKQNMTYKDLAKLYSNFYKARKFVRIYPQEKNPQLKFVANTNFCDIGINVNGKELILIAAIDNLTKGAAGQAVQNMNIMADLPEETGLL